MKTLMTKLISRREMLRQSFFGAAGLYLAGDAMIRALPAPQVPRGAGRAKSVIQIWLSGGPSHIDTFDPKPDLGPISAGLIASQSKPM